MEPVADGWIVGQFGHLRICERVVAELRQGICTKYSQANKVKQQSKAIDSILFTVDFWLVNLIYSSD